MQPAHYSLPPLFLQPLVENAIKHGLMNKQRKSGAITIQFRTENDQLICVVEDDGIGRAAANEILSRQQSFHQSFSTQSIHERIELLNAQQQTKMSVEILDLFDQDKPAGTRVTLNIPQTVNA